MNEAEQVKQKIQNYFSQKDEIDTVLLFGSFAKGTFNSHSDIDIALHSKNSLGYEELSKIQ
ncbi:MAG: nucleotidyltransferase domain-containing protein [Treponema sp.]|uniref:nucleotidyltransferase domain-containing protein n=1 Tax=Treponema sp. TaxID=166 RepID=UPI0025DD4223|nr:nucleotidyltransferase domain-containing protein [Treponema sp.]MBQ9281570.1 nucleotidyltransferase domain-containing protein [Treponema sp.]MBR1721325.1 nucleotidyltransferase domain-containing protein [Treponema sp.]